MDSKLNYLRSYWIPIQTCSTTVYAAFVYEDRILDSHYFSENGGDDGKFNDGTEISLSVQLAFKDPFQMLDRKYYKMHHEFIWNKFV